MGTQLLGRNHIPIKPTYKGDVFQKYDKNSPQEPSQCLAFNVLFECFQNGMDPESDAFMTDAVEINKVIDGALTKIIEQ